MILLRFFRYRVFYVLFIFFYWCDAVDVYEFGVAGVFYVVFCVGGYVNDFAESDIEAVGVLFGVCGAFAGEEYEHFFVCLCGMFSAAFAWLEVYAAGSHSAGLGGALQEGLVFA